ncbi:SpaA isopeptide-forming pilin-related protein, partial [uncultured Ruminococcus sp.]|uniref:SpaA isopeptide-forming pilin-related protein n=1 Tax=uncultured Ruminococcus sp. TaxID=165186 RepID=UPI0026755D78
MNAKETKSFRVRLISVFLAAMVLIACLPSVIFASADSTSTYQNPLVLTNASVEFRDNKFQPIDEAESGAMFYLMATISGNNVNQTGEVDTYQIYITDSNLLLPNFAGNGFTDGSVYNGYTLHVEKDASGNIVNRYVEFSIQNGDTKVIRLQAKYQAGKTPNGEKTEVKLVRPDNGKSISNTITAKAEMMWNASKSEDKTQLNSSEITAGTTVNYTLSAASNNSTKKTGVEWVETLRFQDTISLTGLTFAGGAQSGIENAVKAAAANAGYTIKEGTLKVSAAAGGTAADISFEIGSKNPNAEMGAVRLNVALPLNSSTVTLGKDNGTVKNTLAVSGKPYGSNDFQPIGGNDVSLNVTAPKPASFRLGKSADNKQAYYVKGDSVAFTISATNTGDAAGDVTLTDVVPAGMTITGITSEDGGTVSGNSVTFRDVAGGKTVTAKVVCTVDADDNTTLTNEVTDGKSNAKDSITVKKDEAVITATKNGLVSYEGGNLGQKYYTGIAGQTVTYTISVNNSGIRDAAGVPVTDDISGLPLTNVTYAVDGQTVAAMPSAVDVPAGKTVTITITGTLPDTASGSFANTATVDGKKTNTVTIQPETPSAHVTVKKSADKSAYQAGDTLTYTVEVVNDGQLAVSGATFLDNVPDALENVTASAVSSTGKTVGVSVAGNKVTNDGTWDLAQGEIITVTITGTVKTGTTDTIANTASCGYNGKTAESPKVETNRDTTGDYQAEKWIIDAKTGETLVDTADNVKPGFQGFSAGKKATFRARFTNLTGATVKGVKLADGWYRQTSADGETSGKIVDCTGTYTGSNDLSQYYWRNDASPNATWGYLIPADKLTLEPGQYIEFEYTTEMNSMSMAGAGSNYYRNYVAFYPLSAWNKESGMWGATTGSYASTSVKVPYDFSFNTAKSVSPASLEISDLTQEQLESQKFTNTITLSPDSQDATNYYGNVFTLTDVLPDGMTLADTDLSKAISITGGRLDAEASKLDGNELTIAFTSDSSLNGGSSSVKITYQTVLTAAKAEELSQTADKSTALTNTVTRVVATDNGSVVKDKAPNAEATVTLKKITPAPGFAKLAAASYAGTDYTSADVQKVENGYITAGDTLIWQAVLYNGKGETTDGKATLNGDELGKLSLSGVTLTDNLPGSYQYDSSSFPAKYFVVKLDADGKFATDASTGLVTGSGTAINPAASGSSVVWDLSGATGTGISGGKLEPNYAIVVQFATVVKAGQEKEGVITNTGYASTNKTYPVDSVVAGEEKGTQIWNYANYNIVGLTTESWKTITYTNHGHDGTPHTDPKTDTGESRNPTHNYVQGMQGEQVKYTLHVKNNSPVDVENMTIIDRLPYVGDLGLVSGYDRNSAFGVTMGDIQSVTVNGSAVSYDVTYSTNKTATLNEYSKDWLGQNDAMSWTQNKDGAVNFRLRLTGAVVEPNDEVIVTFTATVPSYVAKTGEENIAWNSFAYAYQNRKVLGDTVMVAEPAKVGVWVQTPDTTIDVTVNKELTAAETQDATFYFALFADANYGKRLSDVVSVTIPAGQTKASVTMKDIDLASIQKAASLNQSDNIYLLETDAKGSKIQNYTADYTDNTIPLSAAEAQTVTVKNTKNVGEITLTKTLAAEGDSVTGDTFYFALFTKSGEDYVRYEAVPVQALTFTEAGSQTLTFTDVPKGVDFYVLETNANGVLADTDFTTYTSDNGIHYTSAVSAAVQAGGKAAITNTETINYSITVSKVLNADDITGSPSFTVGLFTKDADGYTQVGASKTVTAGGEVTFDQLAAGTYYVFEMNGTQRIDAGGSFTMSIVPDVKDPTTTVDKTFYVAYDGCGGQEITLTRDAASANGVITNSTENPTKITVTKTATIDGVPTTDHEITVGLYTAVYDENGVQTGFAKATDKDGKTIDAQKINLAAGNSTTFENLAAEDSTGKPIVYYVFELNDEGAIVRNNTTTVIDGKTYLATYSGGDEKVILETGVPGQKSITDANESKVKLTIAKVDVAGNAMEGCQMTLTGDNGYSKPWKSGTTAEVLEDGLAAGKYTLTENMDGFAPVSITFEVSDEGYFVTTDAKGNAISGDNFALTEDGLTVINRAQLTVNKVDIANSEELPGAKITITKNDGKWISDLVTVDGNLLDKTDSTLQFESGDVKTAITGLPDGEYTMEEVAAPEGYEVVTKLNFTIKNGKVGAVTTPEGYEISGNDITMKDSAKDTIYFSKKAVGGTEEISGAEMTLTYAGSNGDLSGVTAKTGTISHGDAKTITWTSGDKAVELYDLPDGEYILHEKTAPDGFTCITDFRFTITDGKVTTTGTASVETEDAGLTVRDDASSVSIVKVGKDGEST